MWRWGHTERVALLGLGVDPPAVLGEQVWDLFVQLRLQKEAPVLWSSREPLWRDGTTGARLTGDKRLRSSSQEVERARERPSL